MFTKKWYERKQKLNRKLVVRITEPLYQKLLLFLKNNPRYHTVSTFVRMLLYDQLECQSSNWSKNEGGDISGGTKTKPIQGQE